MTTMHARSKAALSTDELRRRTGRAPVDQMFDDLEQQITAYRAREQRQRRIALWRWFGGCLVGWTVIAWWWWA